MRVIIDSSAWIEYLEGSFLGEEVRKILVGDNELYALNLIIAEVISKVKRKKGNVEVAYQAITSNAKIFNINPTVAKEAGLFHAEIRKKVKDFGLVDALILISARKLEARVLTGDKHFKGFRETIFVG